MFLAGIKAASVSITRKRSIRRGVTFNTSNRIGRGVADGDQRRDFIGVDDVVRIMIRLLATPSVNGIFNVVTGVARSFSDLI
jgi:ADP-L-glycero-D-manno-heptose 6-epimerase